MLSEQQSTEQTTKLSFRLNTAVASALAQCAEAIGYEPMAYAQKVLTEHATRSGYLTPEDKLQIELNEKIIGIAVRTARSLHSKDKFDADFVLTVFRHIMDDRRYRAVYEQAVGGDAYTAGLPGKTPLNMYLGWYIKNAVGAEPIMLPNGKPARVQVKNEPIQSYTRLVLPAS